MPVSDPEVAAAREAELVALGAEIGRARIDPGVGATLLQQAGAGRIAGARATLAKLIAGQSTTRRADAIVTMRQLGKAWTSGAIAAQYPDHVRTKATCDKDAGRLVRLCRTIGDVHVTQFRLAHGELAMRALPTGLTSATRRQYAQILARLCHLAVYPLKLIAVSPLPRGFLPKVKRTKATAWLYPAEEAQLLACADVPLGRRVLYGFLAREGLRCNEALRLRWEDFDLVHGAVRLDRNKTDDPRAWALTPGVAVALKAWRPADAEPSDLVFARLSNGHMAEGLRTDLGVAKVKRTELFERSKSRLPIRLHDLRATFVTLALAAGRSEAWVSDRTGHRSSIMIQVYRRAARTAAELGLGELVPLDVALGLG